MLPEIEEIGQGYRPYPEWPFCYELYEGPLDHPKRKRKYCSVFLSKFEVYAKCYNYFNDTYSAIKELIDGGELPQNFITELNKKISLYSLPKTEASTANIFTIRIVGRDVYFKIYKLKPLKLKLNKIYKLMDTMVYTTPTTFYIRKNYYKDHCKQQNEKMDYSPYNKPISDQYKQWLLN